ncbi:MAG: hypothetical protein ACLRPW_06680 [Intestinibacter sp.]
MFNKSYVTKDVEQIDVNSEYFPDLVYAGLKVMEVIYVDLC